MTLLLHHYLKLSRRNNLQRIIMCIDVLDEFNFFPRHPGHFFCLVCPRNIIDLVWPNYNATLV